MSFVTLASKLTLNMYDVIFQILLHFAVIAMLLEFNNNAYGFV